MAKLGNILRQLREEKGLSLADAASKIGFTDTRLLSLETKDKCSVKDLCSLATLYDKSVLSILDEADMLNQYDQKMIRSFVPEFGQLSDEHKEQIQKQIGSLKESERDVCTFRLGELFCGPGGLACGAMNARSKDGRFSVTHSWANDFDLDTCKTYTRNICPDNPESVICEDVRELDLNRLPQEIDGFAFGFPCNDFSVVGEQKGINGTYGPLYQYGVNVLKKMQPKWFIAENVSGLSSANEGETFNRILGDLQKVGYVITPHLYRFEDYGIPQTRHRIIIVGIRKDITDVQFHVPSPEVIPQELRYQTAREAIETPPIPADASNNERTRQSKQVVERLNCIKPGENAFTADLPEHLKLKIKGARISQIYKRLDPDKPAYTVTGSGGGGTHIYHWEEPRALTNRERARLQTFPDTFIFEGSKESVRKQIGMAVPCRGAQIIVEAVLNSFAGCEYPSVNPNIKFDPIAKFENERQD